LLKAAHFSAGLTPAEFKYIQDFVEPKDEDSPLDKLQRNILREEMKPSNLNLADISSQGYSEDILRNQVSKYLSKQNAHFIACIMYLGAYIDYKKDNDLVKKTISLCHIGGLLNLNQSTIKNYYKFFEFYSNFNIYLIDFTKVRFSFLLHNIPYFRAHQDELKELLSLDTESVNLNEI